MEDKYDSLGELLKHSSTILNYRSLNSSHGNAHESLPCRFLLSKKLFCLQTPSSRYFQVSHSMLLLSEIKQNKIFFPAFFCSSAIAKNSTSFFILFSTMNSDISKLDNLQSFFFLLFCSFCC